MCKICEALKNDKMDSYSHKYREELPIEQSTENADIMACIVPPTPISERRHRDDGLISTISVWILDENAKTSTFSIPIKYCPICGKEII